MIQPNSAEASQVTSQSAPVPSPGSASTTPSAQAQVVCGIPGVTSPANTYQALLAKRSELQQQRVALVNTRDGWSDRLRRAQDGTADKTGIEAYIKDIDARLADVTGQLAATNTQVACVAGVPGAVRRAPDNPDNELALAGIFLSAILAAPLVFAWSRRIWRRGAKLTPFMPRELDERLTRIEQTVESVAIEVERVGEGQRFVTNLFAQNGAPRAVGAGAMEPVDVQQRERVAQERLDR